MLESIVRLLTCDSKQVLRTMQQVTMKFVKHIGQLKGLPSSVIDNAGGKIFTFGSYRLGVFGPGAEHMPALLWNHL